MKLHRDLLISLILSNQNSFFRILDYIDQNDGSNEFPEHLYHRIYNNEICHCPDDKARIYLTISSLTENGIFIHNDKHTGMITIEKVILDLLRFLDVKRARELTRFDFEQLRKRVVDVVSEITTITHGSDDYKDAMKTFNAFMSEIHSLIKENVASLHAQTESIAKDYKMYDEGGASLDVFDLYERVSKLYSRYVKPCYEFINPSYDMVQTQSFSDSVKQLVRHHSKPRINDKKTAISIQYKKTAITSYYKNIASIARRLEQFSNHLKVDRANFLAIESAFSELMDDVDSLRHGMKRDMYLSPKSDFFKQYTSFDGLSRQKTKYSQRLSWNKEKTKLRFKEYWYATNEKQLREQSAELLPISYAEAIDQDRQIEISKILFGMSHPDHISDVHQYLFEVFKNKLPDFALPDVLYALEAFVPTLDESLLIETRERRDVTDTQYYLNYIQLGFKEAS